MEDAQAETVAKFGPLKPYFIEICPGAISIIILGIKNGLNLGVPSPLLNSVISSMNVLNPPIPDPQITPALSGFKVVKSIFASFTASSTDAMAYCTKGSSFLASFLSMKSSGLKFFNSQANRVLNLDASKRVIGPAPLTPAIKLFQNSGTVLPSGVSAPNPVTTTLLSSIKIYLTFFSK